MFCNYDAGKCLLWHPRLAHADPRSSFLMLFFTNQESRLMGGLQDSMWVISSHLAMTENCLLVAASGNRTQGRGSPLATQPSPPMFVVIPIRLPVGIGYTHACACVCVTKMSSLAWASLGFIFFFHCEAEWFLIFAGFVEFSLFSETTDM